jgi:hypothetical protein
LPEVLDYSAGWPRKIAPFVGTVRYVGTPGRSKNLTQAEAIARQADGTPQAFVHEAAAGWMLGGKVAGQTAAARAHADLGNLGQTYRVVYFACDVDITDGGELGAVDACLDGAAAIIGRDKVGVYGEYDVIEHCLSNGHAAYGWQTRAWSGRNPDGSPRVSRRAALYQQVGYVYPDGVQCDRNTILLDDWGQWPRTQAPPEPDRKDPTMPYIQAPNRPGRALIPGGGVGFPTALLGGAFRKAMVGDALTEAEYDALWQFWCDRTEAGASAEAVARLEQAQAAESAAVTALAALIAAGTNDLTVDKVVAAVKAATAEALAAGTVSVDVSIHGEPPAATP